MSQDTTKRVVLIHLDGLQRIVGTVDVLFTGPLPAFIPGTEPGHPSFTFHKTNARAVYYHEVLKGHENAFHPSQV